MDEIELVESIGNRWPETQVTTLTAFAKLQTVVKAPDRRPFDRFDKLLRTAEFKASANRAPKAQ